VIRTPPPDGTPPAGLRTGSTKRIHRMIRLRRLRTAGPFVDRLACVEPGGRQWLDRAWRALYRGDYQLAAYAAGISRQFEETDQSALILARAAAGMDLFEEAVMAAQRAVRLAPGEPEHQLTLAGVFEELGNVDAALHCYRVAERLAPSLDAARVGQALALAEGGHARQAEHLLEELYAGAADRGPVGDCLGLVLVEAAEEVPRLRIGETYLVASPEEITAMRAKLDRAAEVARDPELLSRIGEIRRYVETCARRQWLGRRLSRSRTRLVYLGLFLLACVGTAALVFLDGWPAVLLLAALLPLGHITYDLFRYTWVPRWKLNRLAYERDRIPEGFR
jgi:Flp pilus assembly protein TadD